MRSSLTLEHQRILRFGLVGVVNTALGYIVIIMALAMGYGDFIANFLGYTFGLALGFALNSRWTFSQRKFSRDILPKYFFAFLIAYAINLAIIAATRSIGIKDNPIPHLISICAYTAVFYIACSRFVFTDRPALFGQRLPNSFLFLTRGQWPELVIGLSWLCAFVFLINIPVSHDVVWQMWIARQLLGGAKLYVDILEINPPLWFWMAVPIEWLAYHLDISPVHAIVSTTFLLIGTSLFLLSRLLVDENPITKAGLLIAAFAALIVIPIPDFAQREHLCLIGLLPYIILAARRADGTKVSTWLALGVGLVAAPGLALKHYFVLAPILLELWILYKRQWHWQPIRPETLVLAIAAFGYGLTLSLFSPEYFSTIIPMVQTAYGGYETTLVFQLIKPWTIIWIYSLSILFLYNKSLSSITISSAICFIALCASYFAQGKGWGYHALPATGALFFSLATLFVPDAWKERNDKSLRIGLALLLPILTALVIGPYNNKNYGYVADLLSDTSRGTTAIMLTGSPPEIWPVMEDKKLRWPSRYFTFWMVYIFIKYEKEHGDLSLPLNGVANIIRSQTVEDFRCNPPEIILVDSFLGKRFGKFDILAFFQENDDFREFFSHYRKVRTLMAFTSYRKDPYWNPDRPANCRTIY